MLKQRVLKKVIMAVLLFGIASIAQAEGECLIQPQDDIIVTPSAVRVVGASGDLSIAPDGQVSSGGTRLTLSAVTVQKAQAYQAALRRQLPLIESQTQQKLTQATAALDKVLIKELGSDSKVRGHLQNLSTDLRMELSRILEKTGPHAITFHHQAIKQAEKEGRSKVERALGAVLQDSLNELGSRSLGDKGGNPLQAMLGGIGELQQSINAEWKGQEKEFQRFGEQLCETLTTLEMQRAELVKALPK